MELRMLDESRYAAEMREKVLPALAQCRTEGWMEPADVDGLPALAGRASASGASVGPDSDHAGKLHYVCYDAAKFDALHEDDATGIFRGAVVISHGFTEFASKYCELIWYFLLAGYSVCLMEHRGHGYSARDVDDDWLVWIDDWRRYVADLAKFADTVGKRYADGQPLNLFCHSMGGGIGAAVLEQHPTLFDKAVLSAPMIAPATGVPNWVARALAEVMCGVGLGRHAVFGQGPFSPEYKPEEHKGASEARTRWFHECRCEDVHCQTNAAAFEWVRQALRLSHAVLKPNACENIETPILLFQAGHDIWVLNEPQNRFVANVREGGGNIRLVRYADSVHEIFSMPNGTFGPYLSQILDFYDTGESRLLD
ncbi:alpha/beta fold hydrolase [Bifidobacterium aerophilum]|uniref:Alpha/beta fold hydrolase n=1 Tax=Bifidobacterium aerophilum TaxID=1798155 RepID=A0A6N9Z8G5_9BIFI|nr:alpha/beta fold hydrolase [Bifidobacterium aerophilum]NEG90403.1 alpha/beta fold hydrolase [Bifidobacterium aerophilum]